MGHLIITIAATFIAYVLGAWTYHRGASRQSPIPQLPLRPPAESAAEMSLTPEEARKKRHPVRA
jgi:hypothetical protein